LQDVGDSESGRKRIGSAGISKVMREDALTNDARDPGQEDARRDETRTSPGNGFGRSLGRVLVDRGIMGGRSFNSFGRAFFWIDSYSGDSTKDRLSIANASSSL
jgi:hypothetical protein